MDAIGAFGVLRCAAYSGATGVELHSSGGVQEYGVGVQPGDAEARSSAIDHFYEKLFKLEGMMKVSLWA